MFLYKNQFLLIFSFLSIPIELWESTAAIFVDIFFSFNPNRVMGINGGYFPAFCLVCIIALKRSSNYITPVVFCAIFLPWANFRLNHLNFCPQKRDGQATPVGHYVLSPHSPKLFWGHKFMSFFGRLFSGHPNPYRAYPHAPSTKIR